MANLKDVIFLSNPDYNTLATTGTVTIGSDTLTYDANTVYITPDVLASSTENGLMAASDKSKLDSINLSNYLPLSGGTLSSSSAPILTIKRTTTSAGAFIDYKNNNQDAKLWRLGMSGDNNFDFCYSTNSGSSSPSLLKIDTSGNVCLNNNQFLQWRSANNSIINVLKLNSNNNLIFDIPNGIAAFKSTIIPFSTDYDNTYDLGSYTSSTSKARWKNLYLSGTIRKDNASYGLALPTMSSWTGNRTIATTADIPSTDNFVTLNGDQTLTGYNTFNYGVIIEGEGGLGIQIAGNSEASGYGDINLLLPQANGTLATQEWVQQQIQAAITAALNTPV